LVASVADLAALAKAARRSLVRRRAELKYVYLIESIAHPEERYVGLTDDLTRRLKEHNRGGSPHTAEYRPWRVIVALHFDDGLRAAAFEQYMKSGSGRAFARKHFG
jgi:predicted GIY-YIG superfamily endonuclease